MKKEDSYKKNYIGLDSSGKNQSVTVMVPNYNIQYRMFLNFDQIKTTDDTQSKTSHPNNNKIHPPRAVLLSRRR